MTSHVTLPGSARTLLANSRPAGPVDPGEIISLTIRARSAGDLKALEKQVREQSRQPLAQRKYLKHNELAKSHGAKPEDLDEIEHVAHEHNLTVVHRSAAERNIVLEGRLGDMLSTFPADVQNYNHAGGAYRGRRGEICIPQALKGVVTGVFGFDTRPKHRAKARGNAMLLSGPGGENGVVATTFAKRYNFPTSHQGHALDGANQTIAIIELGGGFRNSDLRLYFNEIKTASPNVSAICVDYARSRLMSADSADGEVMMDIEVAGAVAPKANFAIYFAPNNGNQGFLDAISAAVHDAERNPGVISISWGGPEDSNELQAQQAFHELFVEAAALGITICAASGDHGVADQDAQDWDQQIHVDHPAADDLVLACGGTQVKNGKDVVWNDGTAFDPATPGGGGWASGGGVSTIVPLPDYQQNAKVPKSLASGKIGRGVPDIAMSATNYLTRVDSFEGSSGGTSAVAPLMASLVTLLNQAKGKNVGFLNPLLYAEAANGLVRDVTEGNNGIDHIIGGYSAGPGWDACSGLGTPDGAAILAAL